MRIAGKTCRGATFCSCHRVSSGHLPEHPSRQLLPTAPSDGPQLSCLNASPIQQGTKKPQSLHKLCASSYAAPSPSLHPRLSSFLAGRLGPWQNPRREPADHKCQLCILGPVKSPHLPRLSGDRFIALKIPRRPLRTRTIPHLARADGMLSVVLKVLFLSPRVLILDCTNSELGVRQVFFSLQKGEPLAR